MKRERENGLLVILKRRRERERERAEWIMGLFAYELLLRRPFSHDAALSLFSTKRALSSLLFSAETQAENLKSECVQPKGFIGDGISPRVLYF